MAPTQTIADKQLLAKTLFTREHLDQKVVAKKVGVSERTMSDWVNKYNWKALRNRLLISKEEQLGALYEQLEAVNEQIRKSANRYGDTKLADIQVKKTAAIRSLETDLAIADLVEAGIRFIKHLQQVATPEQMNDVADLWHSFLQASIRK